MTDPFTLILCLVAGMVVGGLFFYGLWLTVRAVAVSKHPMLLTLVSFWLRVAGAGVGFYLIAGGDWRRLLAGLLGFLIVRSVAVRRQAPVRSSGTGENQRRSEAES